MGICGRSPTCNHLGHCRDKGKGLRSGGEGNMFGRVSHVKVLGSLWLIISGGLIHFQGTENLSPGSERQAAPKTLLLQEGSSDGAHAV